MAKKKSKAQINRMKKRAEARGEEYEYVAPPKDESECTSEAHDPNNDEKDNTVKPPKGESESASQAQCDRKNGEKDYTVKLAAARKLRKELADIETNQELKSKDRRSAKRRAEAIASEEAGCTVEDLLGWFDEHGSTGEVHAGTKKSKKKADEKSRKNPCIVFVGQLSFDTTSAALFDHIKNELGKEHEVTAETVQIRLLTDAKTKKSRGMAFVETTDPELLYACLKLHHTHLEGRRINVERTTGGNKNSEARKTKLSQLRKEQAEHMSETVDNMLSEYLSSGELHEKELDEGVIALCKRHSAAVVETALAEYIEKGGRDMDNPSSYLTFLIGKMATEGIDDAEVKKARQERNGKPKPRGCGDDRPSKRQRQGQQTELGVIGNKLQNVSTFFRDGVDMRESVASGSNDMSKIFPSMRRGRGRGYM